MVLKSGSPGSQPAQKSAVAEPWLSEHCMTGKFVMVEAAGAGAEVVVVAAGGEEVAVAVEVVSAVLDKQNALVQFVLAAAVPGAGRQNARSPVVMVAVVFGMVCDMP